MSKKKGKGGKRCRDWNEIASDDGLRGVWRHTKHGINIRFDTGLYDLTLTPGAARFEFGNSARLRVEDNPPSKWGKTV